MGDTRAALEAAISTMVEWYVQDQAEVIGRAAAERAAEREVEAIRLCREALAQLPAPGTHRVRFALAIDSKGNWCASGNENELKELVFHIEGLAAPVACYWVDVEVDLPPAPTALAGRVTHA